MKKNYRIKYDITSTDGSYLKRGGEVIAKNRHNELEAKCKLEDYLKGKYKTFGSLIIHSCEVDYTSGFGILNNIFK
jgi:hypothetical protein